MGQTFSTRKKKHYKTQYEADFYEGDNEHNGALKARWNVRSKSPGQETAVGKAGRKRHNNYTRRYGTTKRVRKPLQKYVVEFTRENAIKILRILDTPMIYIKEPQRLQKDLLTTFSIDADVHTPVDLFERINEIPALVLRLRWEPEVSATLEKIRDTNAALKLLLLPPNERTVYRERLRREINNIITKPTNRDAIEREMGAVLRIKDGEVFASNVEEVSDTHLDWPQGQQSPLPPSSGNAPFPSVIEIIPMRSSKHKSFASARASLRDVKSKKPWYQFWGGTRRRRKQKTMKQ